MIRTVALLALPVGLLLAAVAGVEYADLDLWGRLSVGAVLAHAGHVPRVEDFTFTAQGRAWIDHEWLAGVVFYAILAVGGGAGLTLFKYAAAALSFGMAAGASRARFASSGAGPADASQAPGSAPAPVSASLLLAFLVPVALVGFVTTVRAQIFSFLGFAFGLWILENVRARCWSARAERRALAALALCGVAWGNAHGGVVMGAFAVALYALGAVLDAAWLRARRLAATALAMIVGVVFVNPYGPVYGRFLAHAWTLDRSAITEWAPLWELPPGLPRALAFAAASLGLILAAGRGIQAVGPSIAALRGAPASERGDQNAGSLASPALVLGLVVCMTWLSLRIQPFLALALAGLGPALVGTVADRLDRRALTGAWIALPLGIALVAFAVAGAHLARRGTLDVRVPRAVASAESAVGYPVDAVTWMRAKGLEGRLLNPFTQGEFLLWTLYPDLRISMDGRYEEVYTQEEFAEMRNFLLFEAPLRPGPDPAARRAAKAELEETLAFAERTRADWILAPAQARVVAAMASNPGWRVVWRDPHFAVLGRAEKSSALPPASQAEPAANSQRVYTLDDFTKPADRERFAAHPG